MAHIDNVTVDHSVLDVFKFSTKPHIYIVACYLYASYWICIHNCGYRFSQGNFRIGFGTVDFKYTRLFSHRYFYQGMYLYLPKPKSRLMRRRPMDPRMLRTHCIIIYVYKNGLFSSYSSSGPGATSQPLIWSYLNLIDKSIEVCVVINIIIVIEITVPKIYIIKIVYISLDAVYINFLDSTRSNFQKTFSFWNICRVETMVEKCEKCSIILMDFITDIINVVLWVFWILCNQLNPNRLHCVSFNVCNLLSSTYL